MKISESEKRELLRMADSESLRDDMRYVSEHKHNPVMADGSVDLDRWLSFLNDFNEFINHEPRPFRKITGRNMKL